MKFANTAIILGVFSNVITALQTSIQVSTDLDRIGRFRYHIYQDEMQRPDQIHRYVEQHADHHNKVIIDDMDGSATNYIAENENGEIIGCLRLNYGSDRSLGDYPEFYEVSSDPDILAKSCFFTRFAILPEYRSSFVAYELMKRCYIDNVVEEKWQVGYMLTNRFIVHLYERVGFVSMGTRNHKIYGDVCRLRIDLSSASIGPLVRARRQKSSPAFYVRQSNDLTVSSVSKGTIVKGTGKALPSLRKSSLVLKAASVDGVAEETDLDEEPKVKRNFREDIEETFQKALRSFMRCETIRLMSDGNLTLDQYKSILREIYYYVREDPQIQLFYTVFLRGEDRESVKALTQHALSEIGHEKLALADLKYLGEDVTLIPTMRPLPTTMGLIAFAFYQVGFRNPVGHLGYLYFLEFLPTAAGQSLAAMLQKNGIPSEATTFLHEHTVADIGHNKLMEKHIAQLIKTQEDCHAVMHAIETTSALYTMMLDGAIKKTSFSAHLPDGLELR